MPILYEVTDTHTHTHTHFLLATLKNLSVVWRVRLTYVHLQFNIPGLEVESDLKLEVFYYRSENLHPVLFEWCESVWGDRNTTKFWLATLKGY